MEKEHQETIHQPAADPVPEVIEKGEEETKKETEESIYNNKLKTLKVKTNCCRTRKFMKVVKIHYLISQLLKSFAFFSKRKIHSRLTIMCFKMMKLRMVGIDLEEAQHQKTHEWLRLDPPTPIHFYLILISKLASMPNF